MIASWMEFANDALLYLLIVAAAAALLIWVLWKLQSAGRQ